MSFLLQDEKCVDFEEMPWYEALMFYGYKEGEDPSPADLDLKLIPSLIEKVLLPKLTGIHILSLFIDGTFSLDSLDISYV